MLILVVPSLELPSEIVLYARERGCSVTRRSEFDSVGHDEVAESVPVIPHSRSSGCVEAGWSVMEDVFSPWNVKKANELRQVLGSACAPVSGPAGGPAAHGIEGRAARGAGRGRPGGLGSRPRGVAEEVGVRWMHA